MSRRKQSSLMLCAAVSVAMASVARADQFTLQHAVHLSLGTSFNGTTNNGSNPLSVAFDGSNAYIGGYNSGSVSANVGIVKVSGLLGGSPTFQDLASFGANASRGINDMGFDRVGNKLYAAYDSGTAATGTVTQYDPNGNQGWQITNVFDTNPSGQRPWALAIDPQGDSGSPCVAVLVRSSGRRAALKTSNGSVLYTITGGSNPGGIFNGVGTATGNTDATWRSVAFDSAGNMATADQRHVSYGTRVNANQWQTFGPAPAPNNLSTVSLSDVAYDNVGKGLAILEGVGSSNLLAFSTGSTVASLTSQNGTVTPVTPTQLQLRNLDGSTTGLTQSTINGDDDGIGSAFTGSLKNLAFGRNANNNPVLVVVSFIERSLDVYTLEPTWTATGGGVWGTGGNWLASISPNSAMQNAKFGNSITGPALVNLDDNKTVKVLKFDSANSYTIQGNGNTLTLDSAGTTQIRSQSGTHFIAAPVNVNKDLNANIAAGSSVVVTGPLTMAAGTSVSKDGAGTFDAGRLQVGTVTVNAGVLKTGGAQADSNTGRVNSLTIAGATDAWTATLDLHAIHMIVDYNVGDPSPLATIANQLKSGFNNGSWNGTGINSSAAAAVATTVNKTALGYAEASALAITTLGGQTLDPDMVVIRYVFTGDANLDSSVSSTDFNILATNFGVSSGKVWTQADFNYDGAVNSADFNLLAGNFGKTAGYGSPGGSVPEPAAVGLIATAGMFLARRRWA